MQTKYLKYQTVGGKCVYGYIEEGEKLVYFTFQHPKTKEELVSKGYSPFELIETNEDTLLEDTCHCDCVPIGETNVVECGLGCDYYYDFILIKTEIR